jgi:hypothetical protein
MDKPIVLGSMDVARLIGIKATLLNKFVERGKYEIEASIRPAGGGRGKERLFGEEDIFGIALVHWLFESGLRYEVIQRVLNQVCGGRLESRANDAAAALLRRKVEMLVITREPRAAGIAKAPEQVTRLCDSGQASQIIRDVSGSALVIPVGDLFSRLREALGGK